VHSSQLYSWRSQAEAKRSKGATEQALSVENAKLKRQLTEKEQELAIIKNATAYFARELT
jgi:transposase